MELVLVELAVGFVGGVLSGVLGVGGGVFFVPALVLLLDVPQREAQGISLAVIIVTAAAAATTHARQGHVDFRIAAWVAPAAGLTAVVGASLAGMLSGDALQRLFSLVLVGIGLQMLLTAGSCEDIREPPGILSEE